MFDTALLLAHGHIGDLLADADRERRANLVRLALKASVKAGAEDGLRESLRRLVRSVRAVARVAAG